MNSIEQKIKENSSFNKNAIETYKTLKRFAEYEIQIYSINQLKKLLLNVRSQLKYKTIKKHLINSVKIFNN